MEACQHLLCQVFAEAIVGVSGVEALRDGLRLYATTFVQCHLQMVTEAWQVHIEQSKFDSLPGYGSPSSIEAIAHAAPALTILVLSPLEIWPTVLCPHPPLSPFSFVPTRLHLPLYT